MKPTRLTNCTVGAPTFVNAVTRPSATTNDSRTMARARYAVDWSRSRSQIAAAATPSTRNATASRFCMKAIRSVTVSCDSERRKIRKLADNHVDDLWVPLLARAVQQGRDRVVDR